MKQSNQINNRPGNSKDQLDLGNAMPTTEAVERTWSEQELAEIQARFDQSSLCACDGVIIHKKIRILDANQTLAVMFGYELSEIVGLTVLDLILPEARSVVLRNTLIEYGKPYEAVGLRQDGSTFPIEILDRAIPYQGHTVRAMVIRATTQHKQAEEVLTALQQAKRELEGKLNRSTTQLRYANERLQLELDERTQIETELRVRAQQQAAVAELGQRALVGTDLPTLMEEAVTVASQILRAEYSAIFELTANEDLLLVAGKGWRPALIGSATVDLSLDTAVGYTLLTNKPVILEDLRIETRFAEDSLLHDHHLVSGINIVIQGREWTIGILSVYTTRRRQFTEDDIHFLQAIATVLAMVIIERKQTEAQIRASRQEKEALLREIHDRVKNNLQIILSLLNLQSGYIEDIQTNKILKEIQNRVRSMALVHEKLYHSENLAQIDFREYIPDLVAHLFRAHRAVAWDINFDIRADQTLLTMDTAVPCGLIINELVTNALTHAFPNGRKGEIRIEFSQDGDGGAKLIIADDGVGFPAGFDFRESAALGLQVVNNLVDQLGGTIELQPDLGTKFKITFMPDQWEYAAPY